jgi:outer membrane biosynthesis protein TonB
LRDPWKALPWVASVSLHATAFFFLAGLLMTVPGSERQGRETELILSVKAGAEPAGSRALRAQLPAAAATHPKAAPLASKVRAGSVRGVPQSGPPYLGDDRPGSPARRTEPGTTWEESWPTDASQGGMGMAVEGSGGRIGWDTASRRLIRRRDPVFPAVLSVLGQEVECEARISVAPSGGVTRVEITRGSGYTEIDAGVEAALRDYLFSRADGSKETVGTVRFRFRLEKTD